MAEVRKTYKILQGGGRVYVGPAGTWPITGNNPTEAKNILTKDTARNAAPSGDGYGDAGFIDDQGLSLTIGNEMEVITEIESLWPIDARKVSAGAMFRAMLLEATLENLYELGLSKVGLSLTPEELPDTPDAESGVTPGIQIFKGNRRGGPDEFIPGVSVVFDGPAPRASLKTREDYKIRRVWLPRCINLTPIDLIASKRGQTMIRLDLTCLMPDTEDLSPLYIVDQTIVKT